MRTTKPVQMMVLGGTLTFLFWKTRHYFDKLLILISYCGSFGKVAWHLHMCNGCFTQVSKFCPVFVFQLWFFSKMADECGVGFCSWLMIVGHFFSSLLMIVSYFFPVGWWLWSVLFFHLVDGCRVYLFQSADDCADCLFFSWRMIMGCLFSSWLIVGCLLQLADEWGVLFSAGKWMCFLAHLSYAQNEL